MTDQTDQKTVADFTHAHGKSACHRHENHGNLPRSAGHRPETDQAEGAENGDAGAEAAVYHDDHGLYDDRQEDNRDDKVLRITSREHVHGGDDNTDDKGGNDTDRGLAESDSAEIGC